MGLAEVAPSGRPKWLAPQRRVYVKVGARYNCASVGSTRFFGVVPLDRWRRAPLGSAVGSPDGSAVGSELGPKLGYADGPADGRGVGRGVYVGRPVGRAVDGWGDPVGARLSVGYDVVGFGVGSFDGRVVMPARPRCCTLIHTRRSEH